MSNISFFEKPVMVLIWRPTDKSSWFLKDVGIDRKSNELWTGECFWSRFDSGRIIAKGELLRVYRVLMPLTRESDCDLAHQLVVHWMYAIKDHLVQQNRFPKGTIDIDYIKT